MKKPTKYRQNYGDYLIKESLEALKLAQIANRTYVIDQATYDLRRTSLMQVQGILDNISTNAYIFLELVRSADSVSSDKLYEQENDIGNCCYQINKLVSGVLKSDKKRFDKLIQSQS